MLFADFQMAVLVLVKTLFSLFVKPDYQCMILSLIKYYIIIVMLLDIMQILCELCMMVCWNRSYLCLTHKCQFILPCAKVCTCGKVLLCWCGNSVVKNYAL